MADKVNLSGFIGKARINQKAVIFTICVVVSVVFWVFTSLSRNYETRIAIPVSYRNLPFTREVEGELPKSLEFHFKGSGFDLFRTHLRNIPDSIIVDVAAAFDKNHQLHLPTLNLKNQFPGDLKAYKIVPEIIAPEIRQRSSKKVPVLVKTQLSFKNRFGLAGNIVVKPDSIELAGAEAVLSNVNRVETETIVINDIYKNEFGSIRLEKNLPEGITISNPYVYFYVPVEEYTEGSFDILVDLPVSQQSRVVLLPQKVRVTYMAPLKYFENIKSSDFKATTSVPLNQHPERLEVRLEKRPKGIGRVKVEPELIDYFIQE